MTATPPTADHATDADHADDSHGRPPRPDALPIDPDGIPTTLREADRWLVWKYEWSDKREEWTKIPRHGDQRYKVDATKPNNGVNFDTALETYENRDFDGVGIITDADVLTVFFDLDDVVDPERPHESVPEVRNIVDTLDTYTEYSPSKTGYHVWVQGAKPGGECRDDLPIDDPVVGDDTPHIECYDGNGGRYATVTGQHVSDTPETVETRPQETKAVYNQYIAADAATDTDDADHSDAEVGPADDAPHSSGSESVAGPGNDLDDDELIDRAKNAENGSKFTKLWNGVTAGYESHSEADLALCGLLAFWTGGDRHRMDRLFRRSGLLREKWDRDDYRERTIDKALEGRSEYYDSSDADDEHDRPITPGLGAHRRKDDSPGAGANDNSDPNADTSTDTGTAQAHPMTPTEMPPRCARKALRCGPTSVKTARSPISQTERRLLACGS